MPSRSRDRLLLLAAAALFSTGGAAIKAAQLTSWQIASFRSGVAALALWLLVPAARRGWTWRVAPVSLTYAATLVLFVVATKLTTAANAIFLQSTAPLYVLLLGPWLLKERISRDDVWYMLAVGLGLSLFFVTAEPAQQTAPDPRSGNLVALVTGITWAITVTGLRWLGRDASRGDAATATVVAGNIVAFLVALPLALPVAQSSILSWTMIAYLGIFQIGLAYLCLTTAIRRVPALEAATLLLVEPTLNPIWAWLVHGERPGGWALLGSVLILGATVVKTWWAERSLTRAAAVA